MKKLTTFLGLCVACAALGAESTTKTTARPFHWESAVKTDVPPPAAKQPAKPTAAEPVSKPVSLPLYYSAQRNVPPLPFNPYPKLPVFDLGDNKFMYDDREVDYSARVALSGEAGSAMKAMDAEDGGAGAAAMMFSASDLWVKITKSNSSNGFLLDVNNTVSGTYYGLGAKSSVDPDPFNTWTLTSVFQATSTNKQLAGTASAATRFYNAVNLDAYVGPSVSIVSPVAGTTVSNDVPLQIRVTDILPLSSVKVYVDDIKVGVVQAGQNGLMSLPSSWFPNGQHQIWVAVGNEGVLADTDGDGVGDEVVPFEGSGNVTVNFTNQVSMQNYSPLYTKAGSITFQYSAMSTQDYTFEVFKTNGTLLHTTNGQFNGSLSRQWNYTDLSGGAVTDAVYVVSLTYSPPTGGALAAAPKKIISTNLVDQGVDVGNYVVSYGEYTNSTLNTGMADMNTFLSVRINSSAYFNEDVIGSGREDYNPVYVDFSSDPFAIRRATQTNDILALTNALKNILTGSWLFQGHSGINNMIPGADGYLTVALPASKLAAFLGNEYIITSNNTFSVTKYKRRLFSTMLTGCAAASPGSWYPEAVGTPDGVDQVANTQIKKSVFLGFVHLSTAGTTKFNWIKRIHQEWLDGGDYDTPFNIAHNRATVAYPAVFDWAPRIIGYRFLQYNADESR